MQAHIRTMASGTCWSCTHLVPASHAEHCVQGGAAAFLLQGPHSPIPPPCQGSTSLCKCGLTKLHLFRQFATVFLSVSESCKQKTQFKVALGNTRCSMCVMCGGGESRAHLTGSRCRACGWLALFRAGVCPRLSPKSKMYLVARDRREGVSCVCSFGSGFPSVSLECFPSLFSISLV